MIHRFVSKAVQDREPKVEVVQERTRLKSYVKYPEPDPRDRIVDEYDFDDEDDQSE